jgi:hypothetical protein
VGQKVMRTLEIHTEKQGTYPMHMGFSCTYHAHNIKKFTKKSEKITPILSILLHRCMKFQVKIPMNEGTVKKIKFMTDLDG